MGAHFFRSDRDPAILDPFVHWDWPDAIDRGTYAELSATFPLDRFGAVLGENNQVCRLRSTKVLRDRKVRPLWRDLIFYLTSQEFWREFVELFGGAIRARYPDLEPSTGKPFEEWAVSRLGEEPGDIVLEAQPVINTPVRTRPSRVRGAHIDNLDKLWAGLLYMRDEDDDTPGGELQLRMARTLRFDGQQIANSRTDLSKSIPYESNRFAGFVNAPEAIHCVGVRPVTPYVRRYLNLYAKLPRGRVFDAPQMSWVSRVANRVAGMAGARRY